MHVFATRAAAAAILIRRAGAMPGRPLAAVTASTDALATLAFAAPLAGVPLFPIDPALPADAIADLLEQAGAALVVGDRPWPSHPWLAAEDVLTAETGPAVAWTPPAGIALLIATSGSSGRPKAVMLSGANLLAAARASAERLPLAAGDRWLACLPLFHIGGFSTLLRCALAGAEAVVHQGFDAERVVAALGARRITHLSVVPAMLAQLLEASDGPPPPSLRHCLVGGAALSPALAECARAAGWPLQPSYGMSETASQLATLPFLPRPWRPGHVGRPLGGAQAALDGAGRLRVKGPMVMAGYANPALRPGDGLEDGWFLSNDLAEITPEGELVILGRADQVIVSGGINIHPALVEDLLAACPGLSAVGVAGRPDPVWGEVVVAVYAGSIAPGALLAWCRTNMASPFRPRAAVRAAALPSLANGKPDRAALRRLAAHPFI